MIKKYVGDFEVVSNQSLNKTNFRIQLKAPSPLPAIKPGQFVNADIQGHKEVFLRRPISVFEVNYQENTITLLVKILGKGSKVLSGIKPGSTLNLVYPLGKGFTFPASNERILLIGGGSGIAPMLFLAKECGVNRDNVDILIGAKSSDEHILVDDYCKYGNLHYTTEDGSKGEKGFVIHHSVFQNKIKEYSKIYTCGPLAMMKAVARFAVQNSIYCEVSLENLMACGFGVCLCCIEPTVKGNLCVCTDGPVFNVSELKWQI